MSRARAAPSPKIRSISAGSDIRRAISLVQNNLLLGILLAVGVLYYFLKNARATLVITLTVPVSLLVALVAVTV